MIDASKENKTWLPVRHPLRVQIWPRFSLRLLLAVFSVLCIAIGFTSSYLVPALRWRFQMISLREGGATIYLVPAARIPWDWLPPTRPVQQVLFPAEYERGPKATDQVLTHLKGLHGVEYVRARGSGVTEVSLPQFMQLKSLWLLDLDSTLIGDSGLGALAKVTSLRMLSLRKTLVTAEGLKPLAKLPKLRYLALTGTSVGDACVELLASFPSLREVDLRETQVTSGAMERLQSLRPDLLIIGKRERQSPQLVQEMPLTSTTP